jgi:nicotinate-nucleotide adenylyltransferase
LNTAGPAYTYQTLRRLRRHPRREWRLIVGEDSLRDFTRWRRWREILRHHILLVGRRNGGPRARPPRGFSDRVVFLKTRLPAVSSTEVRRRRSLGRPVADVVPPPVARYMARKKLYQ